MLKIPKNPWEDEPKYRPSSNDERRQKNMNMAQTIVRQMGGRQYTMVGGKPAADVVDQEIKELNILWKNGNYYLNLGEVAGALIAFSNYAVYAHVVLLELSKDPTASTSLASSAAPRSGDGWPNIRVNIDGATPGKPLKDSLEETMQMALGYVETLQNKLSAITRGGEKDKDSTDVDTCIKQSQDIIVQFKDDECIKFDDLIGLQKEKQAVLDSFVRPIIYKNLYGKLAKGMLLYGPPGTGKTLLAKASATQLQLMSPNVRLVFLAPTGASMKGKYVGETEKNIMRAFRCASLIAENCEANSVQNTGSQKEYLAVLFIDEFDSIAGDRSTDTTGLVANSVNTLLQVIDGVISFPNVILIAATNYPWNLDAAILRRFDQQLLFDYPTFEMIRDLSEREIRKHYFRDYWSPKKDKKNKIFTEKKPCEFTCQTAGSDSKFSEIKDPFSLFEYDFRTKNIDFQALCDQLYTEKYSNSDVAKVMQLAIRQSASKAIRYPFIKGAAIMIGEGGLYSSIGAQGLKKMWISALTRLSDRQYLDSVVQGLISDNVDEVNKGMSEIYIDPSQIENGILKYIVYNGKRYYNIKLLLDLPSEYLLVDDQIADFFMTRKNSKDLRDRNKNDVEVEIIFSKDMKLNSVKPPDKLFFRQLLGALDSFINNPYPPYTFDRAPRGDCKIKTSSDKPPSGGPPSSTTSGRPPSGGPPSSTTSGRPPSGGPPSSRTSDVPPRTTTLFKEGTGQFQGIRVELQPGDTRSCGRRSLNNALQQGVLFTFSTTTDVLYPNQATDLANAPTTERPYNIHALCQLLNREFRRLNRDAEADRFGCQENEWHEIELVEAAMNLAGWKKQTEIQTLGGIHQTNVSQINNLREDQLRGRKFIINIGGGHYISALERNYNGKSQFVVMDSMGNSNLLEFGLAEFKEYLKIPFRQVLIFEPWNEVGIFRKQIGTTMTIMDLPYFRQYYESPGQIREKIQEEQRNNAIIRKFETFLKDKLGYLYNPEGISRKGGSSYTKAEAFGGILGDFRNQYKSDLQNYIRLLLWLYSQTDEQLQAIQAASMKILNGTWNLKPISKFIEDQKGLVSARLTDEIARNVVNDMNTKKNNLAERIYSSAASKSTPAEKIPELELALNILGEPNAGDSSSVTTLRDQLNKRLYQAKNERASELAEMANTQNDTNQALRFRQDALDLLGGPMGGEDDNIRRLRNRLRSLVMPAREGEGEGEGGEGGEGEGGEGEGEGEGGEGAGAGGTTSGSAAVTGPPAQTAAAKRGGGKHEDLIAKLKQEMETEMDPDKKKTIAQTIKKLESQPNFLDVLRIAHEQNTKVTAGEDKQNLTGRNFLYDKLENNTKLALKEFRIFFSNFTGLSDIRNTRLSPLVKVELQTKKTGKTPIQQEEIENEERRKIKTVHDQYLDEVFHVLGQEEVEYTRLLMASQFIMYAIRRMAKAVTAKSETAGFSEAMTQATEDIQCVLGLVHYLLLYNSSFQSWKNPSTASSWPEGFYEPGVWEAFERAWSKENEESPHIRITDALAFENEFRGKLGLKTQYIPLFEEQEITDTFNPNTFLPDNVISEDNEKTFGQVGWVADVISNYKKLYKDVRDAYLKKELAKRFLSPNATTKDTEYKNKLGELEQLKDSLVDIFNLSIGEEVDINLATQAGQNLAYVSPMITVLKSGNKTVTGLQNLKKLKVSGGSRDTRKKSRNDSRSKSMKGGSKGAKYLFRPTEYMKMTEDYWNQEKKNFVKKFPPPTQKQGETPEQFQTRKEQYDKLHKDRFKESCEGAIYDFISMNNDDKLDLCDILTIAEEIITRMEVKSFHTQFFFVSKFHTNSQRWRPTYYLNSATIKPFLSNKVLDFGKLKGNKSSLFKFLMTRTIALGYINYGSELKPLIPIEKIQWYDFVPYKLWGEIPINERSYIPALLAMYKMIGTMMPNSYNAQVKETLYTAPESIKASLATAQAYATEAGSSLAASAKTAAAKGVSKAYEGISSAADATLGRAGRGVADIISALTPPEIPPRPPLPLVTEHTPQMLNLTPGVAPNMLSVALGNGTAAAHQLSVDMPRAANLSTALGNGTSITDMAVDYIAQTCPVGSAPPLGTCPLPDPSTYDALMRKVGDVTTTVTEVAGGVKTRLLPFIPEALSGPLESTFKLISNVGGFLLNNAYTIYLASNLVLSPGYNYWLETQDMNYTFFHSALLMTFDGRSELNGNFFDESAIRSNFGQEMMGIIENSMNQRFNEAEEAFEDPDSNPFIKLAQGSFKAVYSKLLVPTMRTLWSALFGALVPYQAYMLNHIPKPFKVPDETPPGKATLNFEFISKNSINGHLEPTEQEIGAQKIPDEMKEGDEEEGDKRESKEAREAREARIKEVKREMIRQRKLRDIEVNLLNLNLPLSSITEAMALFPSNFDKKIYEDLLSYNTNRNKFMDNYRRQRAAQKT